MIPDYSNLIQEWYTAASQNAGTTTKDNLYTKTKNAISELNNMGTVQKSEQADIILQTFDKFKANTPSLTQWVASNTDIAGNGAYKVIHDLFDTVKNIKGNTDTLTELDKAISNSISQSKEKFKSETPPLIDDIINPMITDIVQKTGKYNSDELKATWKLTGVSKDTKTQIIQVYRGRLVKLNIKEANKVIELAKNHGSKLNFINISNVKFSASELKELLEYLPNIKTFIAIGCGLDNEAAKVLAESPNVKNVQTLILSYNKIEAEGAVAILNSPNLENLSILGIWRNKLGAEGANEIAKSKNLLNLKELHIGGNQIKEAGALAIYQAVAKSTNLINLDLRSNGITEDFAETVSKLEPPKNLKVLNLSFNPIYLGHSEYKALKDSEKLKDVNVEFGFTYGWEDKLT